MLSTAHARRRPLATALATGALAASLAAAACASAGVSTSTPASTTDAAGGDGGDGYAAADEQCTSSCEGDPKYVGFEGRARADAADDLSYYCAGAVLYVCRRDCLADAGFVGPQEGQESYKSACAAAGLDGSTASCCP